MFAPQILHKLLFSNAIGDTAYSQEHLKTTVYAKFGGQTKCIMGNSKIDNRAFSHDVTAAMLVFQNKEMAAVMVYQTNPPGIELYFSAKYFPFFQ